jgi:hypothetical protein
MVGDLSSAGHFLCQGFRELGIATTHIAYQNGWRKNPVEINMSSPHSGLRGRFHDYIKPLTLGHLIGYDAILFLDYFVFPRTFGINSFAIERLQEKNGPSFLWLIGCDSNMAKWGRTHNFELCNPCLSYDQKRLTCKHERDETAENNFLERIVKIIPGSHEYYESHLNNTKTTLPVQLAVNVNEFPIRMAFKKERLNIFHGLNRYGFKGTHIVERVFNSLRNKYTEKANFLINGKLPYKDYINLLADQDVVVDQLFNKSLGINSLLSLASGKILVAGDPASGCADYKIPLPPMISCDPSISGLERSLTYLINNYNDLSFDADDSRSYVEQYHSPKLVAQKFINIFGW